jgi:hypothetical protein
MYNILISYYLGVVKSIVDLYIIIILGVVRLKNYYIRDSLSIAFYNYNYYNLCLIISSRNITINSKSISSYLK